MESEQDKNKNRKISDQGFSLIEIVLSLAIFSMIVGGIALFSVRTIEADSRSRAMQNALENSRFAIESLSKKIRTTYYMRGINDIPVDLDSQEVFFIDNRDLSKNCYELIDDSGTGGDKFLQVRKVPKPDERARPAEYQRWRRLVDCDGFTGYPYSGSILGPDRLVGGGKIEATGGFNIKITDIENSIYDDQKRGFIQMRIDLAYNGITNSPADENTVTLQSGVSTRDYQVVGLNLWDGEPIGYSLLYK